MRVGDYRIVYEVHDAEQIVIVARIGHRRCARYAAISSGVIVMMATI